MNWTNQQISQAFAIQLHVPNSHRQATQSSSLASLSSSTLFSQRNSLSSSISMRFHYLYSYLLVIFRWVQRKAGNVNKDAKWRRQWAYLNEFCCCPGLHAGLKRKTLRLSHSSTTDLLLFQTLFFGKNSHSVYRRWKRRLKKTRWWR